jgi:two-component system, cell cycle sensor histidine kinase and response regulator CckA
MNNPDDQTSTGQGIAKATLENLERQIHLRNAQLLETNQKLSREIGERKRAEQITRTLFRISNAVNTTKDLRELYVSIHHILGEIIDLKNFYIALYHKHARKISFPYFVDQFDSYIEYSEHFNEESSLTGEVILAQKPIFLTQADLQQRSANKRIIGTAPMIWLGVPLKIKEEVIGVMATQSYEDKDHFDVIDLNVLSSVSDQIALALERKRYEQAIVASEKKYRNIIKSIEDGYYEIDLQGNLTLVNEAMCKMLGSGENDLLGMNTTEYMSEQTIKRINEAFTAALTTEQPGKTLELEFNLQKGATRYAETIISAIRNDDDEPTGFRGIARDITKRKADENSRKALEEQLQQSQRLESLGTLAGGIAHDFNNLLMGIQGRTALMLNDLAAAHPHYTQLRNIEDYVESAASLTTRLLGFARGGKYEVRPVKLNALIEKSIEMFGRARKEISISTKLESDLWPIEVDTNQIEQVLLNLLVNAGQAMSGGGLITIATSRIILGARDVEFLGITPGNYVQLTLSDTGEGMDRETIQKIFDPFFTTKPKGHGTGLGLAMVYGIIRNHSGSISVTSTLNEGTTFTILLPATDKEVSIGTTTTSPAVEKGSETILLVDDEPMITEVGQEILAALGYRVLTAASGQEALETYRTNQEQIALLIIDMIMPHMGGGELFDRLKSINPAAKVLLSSGYSIDGQAREILERGCQGFIQKPFSISQLSVKIREILN